MTPESLPQFDEGEVKLFRVTSTNGAYAVIKALDLDQAKRIGRRIFRGQPVKVKVFDREEVEQ